jgi:hypothetical protein
MSQSGMPTSALTIAARVRTNTHYAKVVTAQPGYLGAVALRDKAQAMQRSILFPQVVWPQAPTDIDADLDEYLTAYRAAWAEEQTRTRDSDALDAVIGACERTMGTAIGNPDSLLSGLADDLYELMEQVQAVVARLNGAATPLEAIDADSVQAWRELTPLRTTYDSIRHAQELVLLDAPVMNHRSPHIDDPLADDTRLANLDTILPGWHDADTRYSMQGAPSDRRPWPSDPVEQLVWMVTSDAEVWLPTGAELAAVHAERRERLNPTPTPDEAEPKPPRPKQQPRRVIQLGAF